MPKKLSWLPPFVYSSRPQSVIQISCTFLAMHFSPKLLTLRVHCSRGKLTLDLHTHGWRLTIHSDGDKVRVCSQDNYQETVMAAKVRAGVGNTGS